MLWGGVLVIIGDLAASYDRSGDRHIPRVVRGLSARCDRLRLL